MKAKEILSLHKDKLTVLAEALLEKEVIFKEDLETIFGERPNTQEEDVVKEAEIVVDVNSAATASEAEEKPSDTSEEQTDKEA